MMAIPPWYLCDGALGLWMSRGPAAAGRPLAVPTLLKRRGLVKEGILERKTVRGGGVRCVGMEATMSDYG
jgi:hypothetical protein